MNLELNSTLFAIITFTGILGSLLLGNRVGTIALAKNPEGENKSIGAIEGAVFGLLGLMVAFTFSGAASRFEDRRHLITEEANAIGTAWLRVSILPADAQPEIRKLFLQYLDNRVNVYRDNKIPEDLEIKLKRTADLQQQIWELSVQASQRADAKNQAAMLLLPALNAMFDITTTRQVSTKNHPPLVIFFLLEALTFVSAFLAGFGVAGNSYKARTYKLVFALIMSLTLFVTVDLEYPRKGFIRVDDADQPLIDLLNSLQVTDADRDQHGCINCADYIHGVAGRAQVSDLGRLLTKKACHINRLHSVIFPGYIAEAKEYA
jgi:Protein of unknown function (DUF4239)